MELNPKYVMARCWYALLYLEWACGRQEEGIAEARRAFDLDPLSSYVAMNLAGCLCTSGRLSEAIETARRAVQLDPESFVAQWMLGICLGTAGQFDDAAAALRNAAEISQRHTLAVTSLAGVFGQIAAEAARLHEEAIDYARRAWEEREPPFILWARHFPQFRVFDAEPRFAAILREMDAA